RINEKAQARAGDGNRERPQIMSNGRGSPHCFARRRAVPFRFAADDVDVDVAAAPAQLVDERAEEKLAPARLLRLARDDLGDVATLGIADDLLDRLDAAEGNGLAAELFGQMKVVVEAGAVGGGQRGS